MSLEEIAVSRPPSTSRLDLFANGARPPRPGVPTRPMLPDQTQRPPTRLMTRLLIDPANRSPPERDRRARLARISHLHVDTSGWRALSP
jgi:hypothetical protein